MTDVQCNRCKVRLQVAAKHNPEARLLRKSLTPHGLCANCAMAAFLRDPECPVGGLIDTAGVDCLRLPHIRAQIEAVMRIGHSDAMPDELDWERIIADWHMAAHGGFEHREEIAQCRWCRARDTRRERRWNALSQFERSRLEAQATARSVREEEVSHA